ncbi:hypothetical protein M422DRAFT_180346, partial [Sphaerobolus stellatus SS14]
ILHTLKLEIPRKLSTSFFEVVQRAARDANYPLALDELSNLFARTYRYEIPGRFELVDFNLSSLEDKRKTIQANITVDGKPRTIHGEGNGPISAFINALQSQFIGEVTLSVKEFAEHAIGEGSDTVAASYIELLRVSENERSTAWGVGVDSDTTRVNYKAVLSAANSLDLKVREA